MYNTSSIPAAALSIDPINPFAGAFPTPPFSRCARRSVFKMY
jgi:hypothetical protein